MIKIFKFFLKMGIDMFIFWVYTIYTIKEWRIILAYKYLLIYIKIPNLIS